MRVIVYDDKGKQVYEQIISKQLISLDDLMDKLENFFIELSGG
jgi:hypothetical protein